MILYLSINDYSVVLIIPKNNFFSKANDNPLNNKGIPFLSVNNKTLGTDGFSLMKVSTLADVTSITLLYMYLAA